MPKSKFPQIRRILRRRSFTPAQRAQSHLFTQAATLSCHMGTETEADKAFWCGINYAMNDLWSLTVNHDPVFLKEFWRKLEETLSE